MVASDGGIFALVTPASDGSMGGKRLKRPGAVARATTLTASATGWCASDGGIFAFDATFKGSMGGTGWPNGARHGQLRRRLPPWSGGRRRVFDFSACRSSVRWEAAAGRTDRVRWRHSLGRRGVDRGAREARRPARFGIDRRAVHPPGAGTPLVTASPRQPCNFGAMTTPGGGPATSRSGSAGRESHDPPSLYARFRARR